MLTLFLCWGEDWGCNDLRNVGNTAHMHTMWSHQNRINNRYCKVQTYLPGQIKQSQTKLYYCDHNSPSFDSILSQINSIRGFTQFFFNIDVNIIASTFRSTKSCSNYVVRISHLPHACSCPSNPGSSLQICWHLCRNLCYIKDFWPVYIDKATKSINVVTRMFARGTHSVI
jgi:hypothetical protein